MIRKAAFKGMFYNGNVEELRKELKEFLDGAQIKVSSRVKALIVPHAGYFYSGRCAAAAYKQLKEEKYDSFLILGVNHTGIGRTSISLNDFETPLGIAKNDREFSEKLIQNCNIKVNEVAHANEHSIEVQIPFLQFVYKNIKIIPLIVSDDYQNYISGIKRTINESKKNICLIASSDFTHYGPNYGFQPFTTNVKERLYELDKGAIELIKKIDAEKFNNYLDETGATVCGRYTISLLLNLIDKNTKARLIEYYTSGDVVNDYRIAVGYSAIAFY